MQLLGRLAARSAAWGLAVHKQQQQQQHAAAEPGSTATAAAGQAHSEDGTAQGEPFMLRSML